MLKLLALIDDLLTLPKTATIDVFLDFWLNLKCGKKSDVTRMGQLGIFNLRLTDINANSVRMSSAKTNIAIFRLLFG